MQRTKSDVQARQRIFHQAVRRPIHRSAYPRCNPATTQPPGVTGKTTNLSALAVVVDRMPNHVKTFFPQLQRTFVKSVSDPSNIVVRTRAADGLGILIVVWSSSVASEGAR